MDKSIRTHLDNIRSLDAVLQNDAYGSLMKASEKPVNWAYKAWNEILEGLKHKDNHVRAISAQLLANLAKSDPQGRMLKDFEALPLVTKDERFVTARHCLQSLWKVGLAGKKNQQLVVNGLERRYKECITEKNCTLIRYDIIQDFRNLYDVVKDDKIKEKALSLIETEADVKYRKKYAGVWKK